MKSALICCPVLWFVFAGCNEDSGNLLGQPDGAVGRDASVVKDAGPQPGDASLIDMGGLVIPTCPPGVDFVELPLPEVFDVLGGQQVIARPDGVTYGSGVARDIIDWHWADGRLRTIGNGDLVATAYDATLFVSRTGFVFEGDDKTRQFSGSNLNFTAERAALGLPFGAEFIQPTFVSWAALRPSGVAVNIYDRDRHHRSIEGVAFGPAVSATHVAWLEIDPTSMSEWRWVVEDQRTEERITTSVAQYFGSDTSVRVTDSEAYALQRRNNNEPILHVWEFDRLPRPLEVPANLTGRCQFLAGSASILVCRRATQVSMHAVRPNGVRTIDTGGDFVVEPSQSNGRVLFFETDGSMVASDVPGRVVVLDTTTGRRIELTDTSIIPRFAYLATSFADDIAVWSVNTDDNPTWGAVRLCP